MMVGGNIHFTGKTAKQGNHILVWNIQRLWRLFKVSLGKCRHHYLMRCFRDLSVSHLSARKSNHTECTSRPVSARGVVLVEAAISIPVLLLLCFGMFEIGNLLEKASWLNQSTYLATSLGSERTIGVGEDVSFDRVTQLIDLHNQASGCTGAMCVVPPAENILSRYVTNPNAGVEQAFNVSVEAPVTGLTGIISEVFSLNLSYTAPALARNGSSVLYSGFGNPDGAYDCRGERQGIGEGGDLSVCHSGVVVPSDD